MDKKEYTEQNEIRTLRPEQTNRKRAVLSLRARLIFLLFVIAIPLTHGAGNTEYVRIVFRRLRRNHGKPEDRE